MKRYMTFRIPIIVFLSFMLIGCAEINTMIKDTTNVIAPQDIVTGKRTLNIEPEDEEIKRATTQTTEILNEFRNKGIGVDIDNLTLSKLQKMMNRIVEVSHRPQLPWEIHLIEAGNVNAFTIGGGKLFVYRGLFSGLVDPQDDNELATVLAHEIAHVNCKHVGKGLSLQIASAVSKEVRKEAEKKIFQASFTTVQEDEADRVGLLYMALAGYNPSAAQNVWMRAHEKYGSDPENYTYDHSLHIDRLKKISGLVPIAKKHFKGDGIRNDNYDRLRVENDLIPKTSSFAGESGLLTLLEAALGTYSDYLNAKNEEESRKRVKAILS